LFVPGGGTVVRRQHSSERLTFWLSGVLLSQHLQNMLEFGPRMVLRKVPLLPHHYYCLARFPVFSKFSLFFVPAGHQSSQNNSIFPFYILEKIRFGLIKSWHFRGMGQEHFIARQTKHFIYLGGKN